MTRLGLPSVFAHGARLATQGTKADRVYIILDGLAKVFVDSHEGRAVTLAVLGEGQLVGDFEALGVTDVAPASVVAVGEVVCRWSRPAEFMRLLHRRPGCAVAVARMLASRLAASDRRRTAAVSRDLSRQVAAYLVEIASPRHMGAGELGVRLSQDELAGLMSTSRDSTVRALGKLRSLELVTTRRRTIVVTDPELLARYAAEGVF